MSTDGRAKLVVLTDRGHDVVAVVQAKVPEIEAKIQELLGSARSRDLRQDLQALRAAAPGWR